MDTNPFRWLLFLVAISAIIGAIQCPTSPKRYISNTLRSFGNSITRTLSRNRSGRSSRSGQSGGRDRENSGSGSDREQPASGNNPGGRLPRSRSSSPPAVGGGGAGSSSSLGNPAITRMYGALTVNQITSMCREVNARGDAHVITNLQVTTFASIIREMRETAANDECKGRSSRGNQPGAIKCQQMYVEFKKIPPQYRGECTEAISAHCIHLHRGPQDLERICTFFVRTGMRYGNRMDGYYISLADCIEGIKDGMFVDHQLASVGINPPENPPQPLLPSNYSPEY